MEKNVIELAVVGDGGHAKVVLDALSLIDEYKVVAVLTKDKSLDGKLFQGVPLVEESKFETLNVGHIFVALGCNNLRKKVVGIYKEKWPSLSFVKVIHPRACVSSFATVGEGSLVCAGAVVQTDTKIKKHCIVNTGANVDHDCLLQDFSSVAPGATLGGSVTLKEGSAVSLGASVLQCVEIGKNSVVGASSLVLKDVEENILVIGTPAKKIRDRKIDEKIF